MANSGSLDMVDRCLIALLQVDGRLSHTDMSRRLGLPEATVRRRLKRLVDEGIIQIVALPEPHKVGYGVHAIVGLRLQPGKIAGVVAQLQVLREVRYIGVTAGTYDIVIETFFRDNEGLREFLVDTLGRIDGLVGTETSYILDIVKRAYRIDLLGESSPNGANGDDGEVLERCRAALAELTSPGTGGEVAASSR